VGNEVSILKGIGSGVRGASFIGWSSRAGETAMVLSVTVPIVVVGSFICHYLVAKYFLIVHSSSSFCALLSLIGL
jgi:hypothetical protein